MKILCLGHAAYDITVPVTNYPLENTKNRVHNKIECGGGPSSTAAYLLGCWGADVSFAGIVGDDLYGHHIKEELDKVNVNTKYLELSSEHTTDSSFIIVNEQTGSRTIFTYRPSDMKMHDIALDFIPDIILLDGQEYEMSSKILERYPNAISIIDAGRDKKEIIDLAKKVDYLVTSQEFAEKVTGLKIDFTDNNTVINLYNKMESIFHNQIIVTLEANGCVYKYNDEIKIMPSIKVKPIDTTGAGDIFHGAFTYGISQNYDLETVLKIATIAGAISITKLGGRNSIPTKEEMKCVYDEFK